LGVDFLGETGDGFFMAFTSRQDAGKRLGRHLLNERLETDVVVGLPRGGVVVAAEVARVLHRPLEALVVRKVGHPLHREFAVGALAENDVLLLDMQSVGAGKTTPGALAEIIREEKERLWQNQMKFHQGGRFDFGGKAVMLVDDGLATGATMEAAVLSARKQGARKVIVAVPVASVSAMQRLKKVADGVIAFIVDSGFEAVGAYYESFSQTEDDEVVDLLKAEHAQR
jgi:putative phosphoribosyl transferase